jgi:cell division protein ZapE
MLKYSLQDSFIEFCKRNKYEINNKQVEIIDSLNKFINPKKKLFNFFFKSNYKMCFYLFGNIGVGKTMLLNFVFDELKIKKHRSHFNEFMINFHDFRHDEDDDNSIIAFAKSLKKKYDLIYLDEFQVTNIVDAMILGKLFEVNFSENIKIILTTNTALIDLYKDGLQREQFIPFISTIKKNSVQKKLSLSDDYRLQNNNNQPARIFHPLNEKISFKVNQNFHELTKNKVCVEKIISTKGRKFMIRNFYEGVARFNFKNLCDDNLGSEDYLNISEICNHIFIDDIPIFNDDNSNQQLRFIILIDIFYEKKITLTISIAKDLTNLSSSNKHYEAFKRTKSRLHEMTKVN